MAVALMRALCFCSWLLSTQAFNDYRKVSNRVGAWGGICTCPDGETYEVGDNEDTCASLRCQGGVAGPCSDGGIRPKSAGMSVRCESTPAPTPASVPSPSPAPALPAPSSTIRPATKATAPQPHVSAVGQQLQVSWQIPADQLCPVTHTSISLRPAGATVWQLVDTKDDKNVLVAVHGTAAIAPTSSVLVNGLIANHVYEAMLSMKNCAGWGPWSPTEKHFFKTPTAAPSFSPCATAAPPVAKFGEVGRKPEEELAVRQRAWVSSTETNMLWLFIPLMLGMVLVYRNRSHPVSLIDQIRVPTMRRQFRLRIDDPDDYTNEGNLEDSASLVANNLE